MLWREQDYTLFQNASFFKCTFRCLSQELTCRFREQCFRKRFSGAIFLKNGFPCTQTETSFRFLLNETKFGFSLKLSDLFDTKPNYVWLQINRKSVIKIQDWFKFTWFRNQFSPRITCRIKIKFWIQFWLFTIENCTVFLEG